MNLFRVRGIMLAVHFSFFLLLAVQAFIGWADGGMFGARDYAAILLACFVCVVLHELGHCFTAMRFGIRVPRILLMPIGGMAEMDSIPREPRKELLITLAGPAVNFVIAGLLWAVLPSVEWVESTADVPVEAYEPLSMIAVGYLLMKWNLRMGLFNLIPAFPMDGGRILRALLARKMTYLRATFWATMVGKIVCALAFLATVAAGFLYDFEAAPLLAGLFAFIFLVGEMEYRATRRIEQEATHWRSTRERFPYLAAEYAETEPPMVQSNGNRLG